MNLKQNKEYILCAAIWFDNGKYYEHQPKNIKQGIVVCGRRHHNCFITLSEIIPKKERVLQGIVTEGFLTSTDKFVDRKEAFEIADHADQLHLKETVERMEKGTDLYSEDLY